MKDVYIKNTAYSNSARVIVQLLVAAGESCHRARSGSQRLKDDAACDASLSAACHVRRLQASGPWQSAKALLARVRHPGREVRSLAASFDPQVPELL